MAEFSASLMLSLVPGKGTRAIGNHLHLILGFDAAAEIPFRWVLLLAPEGPVSGPNTMPAIPFYITPITKHGPNP